MFNRNKKCQECKNQMMMQIERESSYIYDYIEQELRKVSDQLDDIGRRLNDMDHYNQLFEDYCKKITSTPVIKSTDKGTVVKVSRLIMDHDLTYPDRAENLKGLLVKDVADKLYKEGFVDYDFVEDPSTGRTALSASVIVKQVKL